MWIQNTGLKTSQLQTTGEDDPLLLQPFEPLVNDKEVRWGEKRRIGRLNYCFNVSRRRNWSLERCSVIVLNALMFSTSASIFKKKAFMPPFVADDEGISG
jgi:hypothetical protein